MKLARITSARVAMLSLGLAAASAVPAMGQTWQGGVDALWATGGNWVGGVAPVAGGNVSIPTTANLTITGPGAAATVTVDSTSSYSIGAVTYDAGGSFSVPATNGAAHTLSAAPVALGNLGISNASDFLLTLSAAPTPVAATSITYTASGAGGITVTGSPTSSTGGIIKSGSGTVTFSGSQNNVTGGFTLNAGTWIGGNGSSFGSRQLTLNGGTVQMNASNPQSQFGNLVSGLPTGIHVTADSTMFYNQTTNQWQVGVTSGVGLLTSANSPKLTVRTGGGAAVWTNYLNMTSFAGTLEIADSTIFRQRSSSTVLAARGSTSVAVNLSGTNGVYECFTAPFADALGNTIPSSMGSLTGTATAIIRGAGNGSTGTLGTEYSVGALNTSTTYNGRVNDGNTSLAGQGTGPALLGAQGFTALTKVGTGTLVLTNTTSNYRAGTIIAGGTLAVAGDGSLGAAYDGSLMAFSYTGGVAYTGTPVVTISGGGGSGAVGAVGGAGTASFLDFSGSVAGTAPGAGYISPPTVTITGTTPTLAGTVRVRGLLTLDGGTLRTDATFSSNRAVFVKSASGINTNGNTLTLTGNVNGSGNLTKSGAGILYINGTSSLGGATAVNAGTLGGTGSLSNSAVTVASGATIAPGNSIGSFTVGSATIGGTFQVEYNGASIDLLTVLGSLDITAATVDFDNLGITAPVTPLVFASYASLTGTFAGVLDLPSGTSIDYNYNGLNQIALVPEPTTLAGLGAVVVLGLRRRRK